MESTADSKSGGEMDGEQKWIQATKLDGSDSESEQVPLTRKRSQSTLPNAAPKPMPSMAGFEVYYKDPATGTMFKAVSNPDTVQQNAEDDCATQNFGDGVVSSDCSKNTRASNRKLKKEFDAQCVERRNMGKKPKLVTMLDYSVNESDNAKNYWLAELKSICDRVFDVSIVDFSQHPKEQLQMVYNMMAVDWEYEGATWDMKKFGRWCRACIKRERTALKKFFVDVCLGKTNVAGPERLDPVKWKRLVDHWCSPENQDLSSRMKETRSCVTDLSRVGRGGVAQVENRAKRSKGAVAPTISDVKAQLPKAKIGAIKPWRLSSAAGSPSYASTEPLAIPTSHATPSSGHQIAGTNEKRGEKIDGVVSQVQTKVAEVWTEVKELRSSLDTQIGGLRSEMMGVLQTLLERSGGPGRGTETEQGHGGEASGAKSIEPVHAGSSQKWR